MIHTAEKIPSETRSNMRGGDGDIIISHYFSKDDFTAAVRLCAKITIPPGASIGSHQHLGEDEVYIVLSGTGELDDGAKKTTVKSGDAILTGNGESHAIRSAGPEPLEIIAVIMCYQEGC